MADEILEKQPTESRLYDIDFTSRLATGDTITAVTSVSTAQAGLTIGAPTFTTTAAQARISSGTTLVLYKITAIVTTVGGDTLELDIYLRVEDR